MRVRIRDNSTKDLDAGKAKARAGSIECSDEFLCITFHTGKFMVVTRVQIDARYRGIGSFKNLRRERALFKEWPIRGLVELLAPGCCAHRECESAESELFDAGEVHQRISSNRTC